MNWEQKYDALASMIEGYRHERNEALERVRLLEAEVERVNAREDATRRELYATCIDMRDMERERDEARAERDNLLDTRSEGAWMARALGAERMAAEAEKLSDAAKAAWDAECIMREQRDRFHAEWKQERQEVERLRAESAPMNEHFTAGYRDGYRDAYRRGAEAMREACAREVVEGRLGASPSDMTWLNDIASDVRDLPIPEEP